MSLSVQKSLGLLLATAVSSAVAVTAASAAEDGKFEHCYGVVKAGQNDCQTSTHICAGKGTVDRDPHTFISLPAGTCAKIAGGLTSEPADKK